MRAKAMKCSSQNNKLRAIDGSMLDDTERVPHWMHLKRYNDFFVDATAASLVTLPRILKHHRAWHTPDWYGTSWNLLCCSCRVCVLIAVFAVLCSCLLSSWQNESSSTLIAMLLNLKAWKDWLWMELFVNKRVSLSFLFLLHCLFPSYKIEASLAVWQDLFRRALSACAGQHNIPHCLINEIGFWIFSTRSMMLRMNTIEQHLPKGNNKHRNKNPSSIIIQSAPWCVSPKYDPKSVQHHRVKDTVLWAKLK